MKETALFSLDGHLLLFIVSVVIFLVGIFIID
jgi:hypothetical protein